MAGEGQQGASMRTVVAASSAGTAFEWYDFFIFGSLAQVISKTFFTGLPDAAGYIAALALFGVGFAFRPLGALVFGKIGDQAGRSGAFLATVLLMGGATFAIAFLPTYQQAGIVSPILLIVMRCVQGFALGGEYGGAAIYVAEHAPADERGWSTSWVQTSAAFGLFGALMVILITRAAIGIEAFDAWGWRVLFAVSIGLLGVSVWMRMKLTESPAFAAMKEEGQASKAPYAEAFGQWKIPKLVILAFLSMMCAQGAVWYTTFFYVQTFMEKFLKVDPVTINELMMTATAVSAVFYVVFGWLGPHRPQAGDAGRHDPGPAVLFPRLPPAGEGRQPCPRRGLRQGAGRRDRRPQGLLAAVRSRRQGGLRDLVRHRQERPGQCWRLLRQRDGAGRDDGGDEGRRPEVAPRSATGLAKAEVKAVKTAVEGDQGRPRQGRLSRQGRSGADEQAADPGRAAGLRDRRHGPVRAPGRLPGRAVPDPVRYTALSLPYHIGTGWVGGFVPFFAFAIVTAVGDIYAGLWYPVAFTLISVLTTAFLLPETKNRSLT
ncbi:MFS transporter [Caulobacter segnis]